MAGSLQDQLLKAGLVSQDQVDRAEQEKKGKNRKRPAGKGRKPPARSKSGAKGGGQEISLEQAYARKARVEQSEKDRSAQEKREKEHRNRELNRKLAEILKSASLNQKQAEQSRFFEWAGKIRKIFVTPDQQKALSAGSLGVVHHKGGFHVVEAETLQTIRQLRPNAVAFFAPDLPQDQGEDDIPEDLVW